MLANMSREEITKARSDAQERKRAKIAGAESTFAKLRAALPRHESRIERLQTTGSMRAAIDLACLDCSGDQMDEVRHCTAVGCPLYVLRPYQADEPDA